MISASATVKTDLGKYVSAPVSTSAKHFFSFFAGNKRTLARVKKEVKIHAS
jgi:hypothetical protein